MMPERREAVRFSVILYVSRINNQQLSGMVKDISRKGMRVIFDIPNIDEQDKIQIGIQRPDYNELVFTVSSVAWKKCSEGKCEVGLKFDSFPVQAKAAFLDYGYKKWLKEK
jgi:hypothetical protein